MPSMLVLKSLRVAAHWNNEATLLIQQRDYSKAAATLTTALVTLKEALRTNTTAAAPTPCVSSSSLSSIHIAHTSTISNGSSSSTVSSSYSSLEPGDEENDVMMMDMETSSSSSSSTTGLLKFLSFDKPEQEPQATFDYTSSFSSSSNTTASSSLQHQRMIAVPVDDDGMFFYHAPIQVTSSEALVSSPLCVGLLSYAIIYNLGLCHHLQALRVQAGASRSTTTVSKMTQLERAVSFYHHAQRLASAHSLNGYRDILSIPILVLVNNMGHAYYCLNKESSMANRCFQQLWIALLEYQKTSSSSSWSMTQDQEHLQQNTTLDFPEQSRLVECFLSNILHLFILGVGTHLAAPAA